MVAGRPRKPGRELLCDRTGHLCPALRSHQWQHAPVSSSPGRLGPIGAPLRSHVTVRAARWQAKAFAKCGLPGSVDPVPSRVRAAAAHETRPVTGTTTSQSRIKLQTRVAPLLETVSGSNRADPKQKRGKGFVTLSTRGSTRDSLRRLAARRLLCTSRRSPTPPAMLASACGGGRCCSVWRRDTMSASASSSSAAEENKQEARPIMHCKGVNDLDKVVLHEVRGSSAEVLVCHSRSICTC